MNVALTGSNHITKSRNNTEFTSWLASSRPEAQDWIATAYFYSVLHLLDAVLHHYGRSCENHDERFVAARSVLPRDEFRHYEHLFNLSILARYQSVNLKPETVKQTVRAHYNPLVKWLSGKLGI